MADQLAARIRQAREEADLTREQMAPMLGVTMRTLGRWETDETKRISVAALARIAAVTEKPITFFLGEPTASEPRRARKRAAA